MDLPSGNTAAALAGTNSIDKHTLATIGQVKASGRIGESTIDSKSVLTGVEAKGNNSSRFS